MIGIIGAKQEEIVRLREQVQNAVETRQGGLTFLTGQLEGKDVVIAQCGIGKAFAAMCAEAMILLFHPDCLINTGVGGSLSPALSIGDIAIAEQTLQHDMDTSAVGDPVGLVSGINVIRFPADARLVEKAKQAVEAEGLHGCVGTVASGDQFVVGELKKRILQNFPDVICAEMEGAAIAQIAYVNHVPYVVLRAVSDNADGASGEDYWTFLQKAAVHSARITAAIVRALE